MCRWSTREGGAPVSCAMGETALLGVVFVFLLFPTPALAYLDPGTGSMVAQVIIAAMLGVLFQAKMIWRRLKDLFARIYARRKQ
jgi:hypothetical protein